MILLLGCAGLYEIRTGRVPEFPSWLSALVLAFVWLSFVFGMVRFGRKGVSPMALLFLLGYTLFAGSDLVLHAGRTASVVKNLGALALVISTLSPFVSSAPRPADAARPALQERQ